LPCRFNREKKSWGKKMERVIALYDFQASSADELALLKGEVFEMVHDDDGSGWAWGRKLASSAALPPKRFPRNFVDAVAKALPPPPSSQRKENVVNNNSGGGDSIVRQISIGSLPPPPSPIQGAKLQQQNDKCDDRFSLAVALYDFRGEQDGDLDLNAGDVIAIVDRSQSWWRGRIGDRVGSFPENYCRALDAGTAEYADALARVSDVVDRVLAELMRQHRSVGALMLPPAVASRTAATMISADAGSAMDALRRRSSTTGALPAPLHGVSPAPAAATAAFPVASSSSSPVIAGSLVDVENSLGFADGPLVHSVSMAEFHLTKGNNLAATYPADTQFSNGEELANVCFPEGAHLHHHDWTFIFLWNEGPLFGLAFYSRLEDAAMTRGAVQKSLLILARKPYFHMFLKVLPFAIQWHFAKQIQHDEDGGDNVTVLKQLYDSLNTTTAGDDGSSDALVKFSAFGSSFQFSQIPLPYDTFCPGASLVELVRFLKEKSMLLWKSLLLRQRILFSGAQVCANLVGNCCIAAPLMILPLSGFSRDICPYVSITDIHMLQAPHYICGATNPLFEAKAELWDTLVSFTSKKSFQCQPQLKLSGADKQFAKRVLAALDDGKDEEWLRIQFEAYTHEFLGRVAQHKVSKEFNTFQFSPLYIQYLESHRRQQYAEHEARPRSSYASSSAAAASTSAASLTLANTGSDPSVDTLASSSPFTTSPGHIAVHKNPKRRSFFNKK
jgi:Stabilization of polarity axis/SH3 domain/Docking domain of Afi1 for Arf3 in vesicle trafficking